MSGDRLGLKPEGGSRGPIFTAGQVTDGKDFSSATQQRQSSHHTILQYPAGRCSAPSKQLGLLMKMYLWNLWTDVAYSRTL